LAPVPFAAVIVSSLAVPEVASRAVVVSPLIVVAGFIVTVITETTLAPTASVAVMVSIYVPAATFEAAISKTATPAEGLVSVFPDCVRELVKENVFVPVPLDTVSVSLAVRPTVVVIAELDNDALNAALITKVTVIEFVLAGELESVAVKIWVKVEAVFRFT